MRSLAGFSIDGGYFQPIQMCECSASRSEKIGKNGGFMWDSFALDSGGNLWFKKNAACPYVANSSPRLNECCFEPLGTSFAL